MNREPINRPEAADTYERLHYSQATRVGTIIWVSGQVGVDPATGEVPSDIESQSRLAFDALSRVLDFAGSSLDDVVELTTYHLDFHGEVAAFSAVKDEYIADPYPSWTAVGTTALARPELRIEIRAVATVSR